MKIKAWLTRDKYQKVFMFFGEKPIKKDFGFWDNSTSDEKYIPESKLPKGINPRWLDEEPIELDITITRASKEI